MLRAAFSITANSQNITSPYGTYPGYLSLIEKDFNRAGERAWLLGFSYDLKDYVKGLSLTFNLCPWHRRRESSNQERAPR